MYCYVHCNPINKFDPLGLAGWLTIATIADGRQQTSEVMGSTVTVDTGAHAWIAFTHENGARSSWGTYGNANGAEGKVGLNKNTEMKSRYVKNATQSRTVWISDKQQTKLEKHLDKTYGKGGKAWSKPKNCSKFAEKTWNKITKDSVDASNGKLKLYSSPQRLGENLKKKNEGKNHVILPKPGEKSNPSLSSSASDKTKDTPGSKNQNPRPETEPSQEAPSTDTESNGSNTDDDASSGDGDDSDDDDQSNDTGDDDDDDDDES